MCFILYGAVNKDIDPTEYTAISDRSCFSFRAGTKHELKMCIMKNTDDYRITDWICDCDFPFASHDPQALELTELESLIFAIKNVKNSKFIYISKTWQGIRNKTEQTVNLSEIDLPRFFADAKVNCLYQINLHDKEGRS